MPEKITQEDFFKSLERLEALANGSDQEQIDKSQICTGPNSEVSNWAGSSKKEIGNTWTDAITGGGTDYNGGAAKLKKARKEIARKIKKGAPLDPNEVALLKSDYEAKAMGQPPMGFKKADDQGQTALAGLFGKKDEKDEKEEKKDDKDEKKKPPFPPKDDEDEDEGKFGKSMEEAVSENETLRKGIEVSEFLSEFAKSFAVGLQGLETRVTNNVIGQVVGALNEFAGSQANFNKSLADAIVNIGHGITGTISQAEQVAQAPVGPPKSQLRAVQQQGVQVLQKGQQHGNELSKAQILDRMSDLVEKGKLNSLEVIKYESTNQMSPATEDTVMKSFSQAG